MTASNLFTRDDTFFGVCEGLGQDLGINGNILRVAFAVSLLANPLITVAAYVGCGVLVFGLRWAFPDRAPAAKTAPVVAADNDTHEVEYAKAA